MTNFEVIKNLTNRIRSYVRRKMRADWVAFFESIAVAERIDESERPLKKFIRAWSLGPLRGDIKKFVADKIAECEEKGTRLYWCIAVNDNWLFLLTDKTEEDTVQAGEAQTSEKKVYCSNLECRREECPRHHRKIAVCYEPQEAQDFSDSDECLNREESR
jgi:hypothetical protein